MSLDRLKALIALETEQIVEFVDAQGALQGAILERDWASLEQLLGSLDAASQRIAAIEQERIEAFADACARYGVAAEAGVGELIAKVPDSERAELLACTRALQVATLSAKGRTEQLDAYVSGHVRTTNALLHEVFPDQKGTMYSRCGRRAPADSSALVVDRQL